MEVAEEEEEKGESILIRTSRRGHRLGLVLILDSPFITVALLFPGFRPSII